MTAPTALACLPRLLQLASPALPVGAFSYSQGLEWTVEAGLVRDEASALRWISDVLQLSLARFELPLLHALLQAWEQDDVAQARQLDASYRASRESAELLAETLQMGHSLRRLLDDLPGFPAERRAVLATFEQPSYALVWSAAAQSWGLDRHAALTTWLWSWAENQVMAALKSVPLGQAAGQRLLLALGEQLPTLLEAIPPWHAVALEPMPWLMGEASDATSQHHTTAHDASDAHHSDAPLNNFAPGFAIASARHETQYSRLFRS